MEREPNGRMSLVDFLRHSSAQLDHWTDDQTMFLHDPVEEGSGWLGGEPFREIGTLQDISRWKERNTPSLPDQVYFVDGRMRVLARVLAGNEVLLFAEAAAGHARWRRDGGLVMGFTQRRPPRLRRILGANEGVTEQVADDDAKITLGERLIFDLVGSRQSGDFSSGEAAYQAVCNVMRALENEEVRWLTGLNGPVVRDGTVHRGDPPFKTGCGPCGLVKRIRYLRLGTVLNSAAPEEHELSQWAQPAVFELEQGERTPFFSSPLQSDPDLIRVFCYLRLVQRERFSPWKGLVRLEVLSGAGEMEKNKPMIGPFFDGLAAILPTMSGDYPWKRLPENIFPMISLEEHLGRYFLSPEYVRTLYLRMLRRNQV